MIHRNSDQPSAESAVKKHRWYFYVLIVLAAIIFLFAGFLLFLTITEFRPKPVEDAITGKNTSCPKFDGSQFRIVPLTQAMADSAMKRIF